MKRYKYTTTVTRYEMATMYVEITMALMTMSARFSVFRQTPAFGRQLAVLETPCASHHDMFEFRCVEPRIAYVWTSSPVREMPMLRGALRERQGRQESIGWCPRAGRTVIDGNAVPDVTNA